MKWKELSKIKPRVCDNILFTDGNMIYAGWLETYEDGEDLCFYDGIEQEFVNEDVTHWMPMATIKLPT